LWIRISEPGGRSRPEPKLAGIVEANTVRRNNASIWVLRKAFGLSSVSPAVLRIDASTQGRKKLVVIAHG
jgi:hypothetical protein